jgi:hypothetical protein
MDKPALILSKLAERFPGLIDSEDDDVQPIEVVAFLRQHQEELRAIAERGAQAGRRKALPKQTYVVHGDAIYIDKHEATDPHVAAARFLKKRKVLPRLIVWKDGSAEVVGQCANSKQVILEGDDYGYVRENVRHVDEASGAVTHLPSLERVLRSEVDHEIQAFLERDEVEGPPKEGRESARPTERRYNSVEEMVCAECTPGQAEKILSEMSLQERNRILETFGLEKGLQIIQNLSLAIDDSEQAQTFWDICDPIERESVLGLKSFRVFDLEQKFDDLDNRTIREVIATLKHEGWI